MSTVNPGPASSATTNSVAAVTPVNTAYDPSPQEQNQLRLLCALRGVSLATTGDVAIGRIRNSNKWVPSLVQASTANSPSGQTTAPVLAFVALYTGAGSTGYEVSANAVLTGLTSAVNLSLTVHSTTTFTTDQNLYLSCNTTTGGNTATIDVFVYGYDLS